MTKRAEIICKALFEALNDEAGEDAVNSFEDLDPEIQRLLQVSADRVDETLSGMAEPL